jgi:hypothetical protein
VFSPEINDVVANVMRFTSACCRGGFREALASFPAETTMQADCPFIQVCEAIVECHVRGIREEERELVGKSLSEAYIHFAGPQHVFEPAGKTRFVHSLRRSGAKDFVAVFLSLHLFNVICREICDEVAAKMPDQETYELYMFDMETMCRDVVSLAMELPDGDLGEQWAATIVRSIETQLFP